MTAPNPTQYTKLRKYIEGGYIDPYTIAIGGEASCHNSIYAAINRTLRTWKWSPTPKKIIHINNDMNINIHIDINMNIYIHIIINMNIEYYIDYYLVLMPNFKEKVNSSTNRLILQFTNGFGMS